ncbi:hypothetical protein [Deinococcus hohokamensis]|uniref:Uncharacterized protein n=1 Tax=Deinococcus hohokamensis TaxID=309883 RepID=A0ABV9I3J4_9DEIO
MIHQSLIESLGAGQAMLVGAGAGTIIALLLLAIRQMLSPIAGQRLDQIIDATGKTTFLVIYLILMAAAGLLSSLIVLFGLQIIPESLQREALEMLVNIFTPLSLVASFFTWIRGRRRENLESNEDYGLLFVTLLSIGGFSGAMVKFYIEANTLDTGRAIFILSAFSLCLLFFIIVIPVIVIRDRFFSKEIGDAAQIEKQAIDGQN